VSADQPEALAVAIDRLRSETSVPGLIATAARAFVEVLDAPACTISRVIGDLLVDLVQHTQSGRADRLGHGYLISDYPLTRAVIEERRPRAVFRADPEADESEVRLLKELGYDSLLMVAIESEEGAWGLVEVYGKKDRRFEDADLRVAHRLADELGQRLRQLERPAA
jgi:transcriptional regulator with GAF, ATPase, and Fis domain